MVTARQPQTVAVQRKQTKGPNNNNNLSDFVEGFVFFELFERFLHTFFFATCMRMPVQFPRFFPPFSFLGFSAFSASIFISGSACSATVKGTHPTDCD